MPPLDWMLQQFLFRLAFGMAAAMAVTPSRWVTAGFFRVHLWVVMGLGTLAALLEWSGRASENFAVGVFVPSVLIAVISFLGSALWLYERSRWGKGSLIAVALVSIAAALMNAISGGSQQPAIVLVDEATAGLLLGSTTVAMLLGHWYLNSPTMRLDPLYRLLLAMLVAIVVRGAVCGAGGAAALAAGGASVEPAAVFLALRWLAGLLVPLVLVRLTWLTLQVPNTQSATGILYAAVILVLIGELTSLVLSAGAGYPV